MLALMARSPWQTLRLTRAGTASFSRLRKKRPHEGQSTKERSTGLTENPSVFATLSQLPYKGEPVGLLLCGSLRKGDPLLCGCVGCFSNPVDSRKAHASLRCGAEQGRCPCTLPGANAAPGPAQGSQTLDPFYSRQPRSAPRTLTTTGITATIPNAPPIIPPAETNNNTIIGCSAVAPPTSLGDSTAPSIS